MTGAYQVIAHKKINENHFLNWLLFASVTSVYEVSLRFFTFAVLFTNRSSLWIIMSGSLALCYSFQSAIMVENLEVASFTVLTAFICPLVVLRDPDNVEKRNSKAKHYRISYSINKILTGIFIAVFISLYMYRLDDSTMDEDVEFTPRFCRVFDLLSVNTDLEIGLENVKISLEDWLLPALVGLAVISVFDGVLTLIWKNYPTSIILFPRK